MASFSCINGHEVDLISIGDNEWECPECGEIYGCEDPDDEDSEESLSVWDAADIYASNGFDEDYQFGYTHEELMKALND